MQAENHIIVWSPHRQYLVSYRHVLIGHVEVLRVAAWRQVSQINAAEWFRGRMKKPKFKRALSCLLVIAVGAFPSPGIGESLLEEGEAWP